MTRPAADSTNERPYTYAEVARRPSGPVTLVRRIVAFGESDDPHNGVRVVIEFRRADPRGEVKSFAHIYWHQSQTVVLCTDAPCCVSAETLWEHILPLMDARHFAAWVVAQDAFERGWNPSENECWYAIYGVRPMDCAASAPATVEGGA